MSWFMKVNDVAAKVLDVLERACLEVVDADDPVALGDEGIAEVRTEKACASGDDGGRHLGRCYRGPRKTRGSLHKGFTGRGRRGPVIAGRLVSACRPRRSARCCAGMATRGCRRPDAGRCAPLRARAAGRASARRHQEARSFLGARQAYPWRRTAGRTATDGPAGSICTSRSTTTAARLRGAAPRRGRQPTASRFLRRAHAWYARARRSRSSACSPTTRKAYHAAPGRAACAELGIETPLHAPLQTADQRQSRSADQDAAARMGLPLRLPLQQPPSTSAPRLPALVQPTTDRTARSEPDHRSESLLASRVRWWGPLGLLAAIRVAIPLAAYADEGSSLPGMPAFVRSTRDGGLTGDATGFYAATREFMAAWGRMPRLVLALDALVRARGSRRDRRALAAAARPGARGSSPRRSARSGSSSPSTCTG